MRYTPCAGSNPWNKQRWDTSRHPSLVAPSLTLTQTLDHGIVRVRGLQQLCDGQPERPNVRGQVFLVLQHLCRYTVRIRTEAGLSGQQLSCGPRSVDRLVGYLNWSCVPPEPPLYQMLPSDGDAFWASQNRKQCTRLSFIPRDAQAAGTGLNQGGHNTGGLHVHCGCCSGCRRCSWVNSLGGSVVTLVCAFRCHILLTVFLASAIPRAAWGWQTKMCWKGWKGAGANPIRPASPAPAPVQTAPTQPT